MNQVGVLRVPSMLEVCNGVSSAEISKESSGKGSHHENREAQTLKPKLPTGSQALHPSISSASIQRRSRLLQRDLELERL